jgi:hypothetical protein
MNRLTRSPALRFLAIGAILFVIQTATEGRPARISGRTDRSPVVVTAEDIAELRTRYLETQQGEPDKKAYDYMIARFVDDELLYREALALGMDRGDMTVRYRLIEKMEYLGEAGAGDDVDDTVNRAIELGLSRSDGMVRNALIQKYSMLVRFARAAPPSEERLLEYYQANKHRYVRPARISIAHVYFSNQERGRDDAREDARRVLAKLESTKVTIDEAIAEGDVFLLGHQFSNQSQRAVSQLFGSEFAREIIDTEPGGWLGPITSSFGSHLVLVKDVRPEGVLEFESVRNQIQKAVEDQMREARLQAKLVELRSVYDVEIQWGEIEPKDAG